LGNTNNNNDETKKKGGAQSLPNGEPGYLPGPGRARGKI